MKKVRCYISALCMAVLAGCIQSSSPSTSATIYLNPGESQVFEVVCGENDYSNRTSLEPPDFSYAWTLTDTSTDALVDDLLHNAQETSVSGNHVRKTTFTPEEENAGTYTVRYRQIRYMLYAPVSTETRSWKVVVNGVRVRPIHSIIAPGSSQTFTATAYPEGNYTYQWFLDSALVGTGSSFAFSPGTTQGGTHTLSVTATSGNTVFSYSRKIIVPLAMAGGSGADVATCFKPTADGGSIAGGYSTSLDIPGTTNTHGTAAYVIKFSGPGTLAWQRLYDFVNESGNYYPYVSSIEQTRDGGYILLSQQYIGSTNGTYLVKLTADGAVAWKQFFSNFVEAVQPTSSGGYRILEAQYPVILDRNIVVKTLDASGAVTGEQTFGGSGYDSGSALCPRDSGGYVITGTSNSTDIPDASFSNNYYKGYILGVDDTDTISWQKLITINDDLHLCRIIAGSEGGYAVVGANEIFTSGWVGNPTFGMLSRLNLITVAKFGDDGVIAWNKQYPALIDINTMSYIPSDIFQTKDGEYWVVGRVYQGFADYACDGYLLRLDQSGAVLGQRTIHDQSYDDTGYYPQTTLVGVAAAADGDYYVLGNTGYVLTGSTTPVSDIFLIEVDANGE